jgi:type IV secretion system protein VirB1
MIPAAALACAIGLVHPDTMRAVVAVEGGGPLAINVNGIGQQHPKTLPEAIAMTRRYMALGYSVDTGWMQVNSRNFPALGLTPETAFDDCANMRAGATVLNENYGWAARTLGPGQAALAAALSAYNTGSFSRGFSNGYVARYTALAGGEFRQILARRGIASQSGRQAAGDVYGSETTVYVRFKPDVPIN